MFFRAFLKSMILNQKLYIVSVFQLKVFQRVTFRIKNFTMCQVLNQLFRHASDFELNILQRVRI